jgi:hypothetical protein
VVESSALLKRRTPKGYRGFESLPHRASSSGKKRVPDGIVRAAYTAAYLAFWSGRGWRARGLEIGKLGGVTDFLENEPSWKTDFAFGPEFFRFHFPVRFQAPCYARRRSAGEIWQHNQVWRSPVLPAVAAWCNASLAVVAREDCSCCRVRRFGLLLVRRLFGRKWAKPSAVWPSAFDRACT